MRPRTTVAPVAEVTADPTRAPLRRWPTIRACGSCSKPGGYRSAPARGSVPVVAGINLEYFFSYIDPAGYGCGSKLPHNVTSLLGVMDGAQSDLRTGLPWQMVEIHEPSRLSIVVEGSAERVRRVIEGNPAI